MSIAVFPLLLHTDRSAPSLTCAPPHPLVSPRGPMILLPCWYQRAYPRQYETKNLSFSASTRQAMELRVAGRRKAYQDLEELSLPSLDRSHRRRVPESRRQDRTYQLGNAS
eukprot:2339376-Rhodomonas_salina.2